MTLEEAKEWLRGKLDEGAPCPCCTQFVKVYKRSITSSAARWLIWLVLSYKAMPPGSFVDIKRSDVRGGDYAKLRFWNLIESQPNDDPEKRSSGMWRPTSSGVAFAMNQMTLPKYAHVFDDRVLKHSGAPVAITETLGKKFNYEELMKGL
jgi:hypothetical protein